MAGAGALDRPETAEAIRRYRQQAAGWAVAGLITVAAGGVTAALEDVPEAGWRSDVIAGLLGLGGVLLLIGLGSLWFARRMRRVLGAGDWSAHAVAVLPGGKLVLRAPGAGELWPLSVEALQQRWAALQPGGVLWWCGDPRRGGVIAPPGGAELVWASAVRGARKRARLAERAIAEGLLNRVAPRQPEGAAGATSVQPPQRGRLRGAWPWLALFAVAAGTFVLVADWDASYDRPIALTVVSEKPDGHCVVRWTDPEEKRQHVGPFWCSPDRGQALSGRDIGYVVADGPWRGELYNPSRQGRPGQDLFDAVLSVSLVAAIIALGVSLLKLFRRRIEPVRYAAAQSGHPVDPGPYSPTYDVLAALAERQVVVPKKRLPEADVRTVPWWRVRGLRRLSELSAMTFTLLWTVVLLGLAALTDERVGPLVAGTLGVASFAVSTFRFLTHRRGVALLLARAARAPVPVAKRYVLLRHPNGGEPALVLFPAHGGADDRPEGLLPLVPFAVPDAPVGDAELRGWLDQDGGDPVVVAWVDGRAAWPAGPYLAAGEPGVAAFLDEMRPAQAEEEAPRD